MVLMIPQVFSIKYNVAKDEYRDRAKQNDPVVVMNAVFRGVVKGND